MKAYTDIEQSKKLAEILPIESADMRYSPLGDTHPWFIEGDLIEADAVPCWSLVALLNILDYPQLSKDKIGDEKVGWMVSVYPDNCRYDSTWYDNPIDACVKMILKLHEIRLIVHIILPPKNSVTSCSKKMKEYGYEWDAEKKELKKIEDGIEIPFGAKDSELQEDIYYIPKGFHAEIDDDKVVIKKGEKSAAWSEKDEEMTEDLIKGCVSAEKAHHFIHTPKEVANWLKSLKDRIGG